MPALANRGAFHNFWWRIEQVLIINEKNNIRCKNIEINLLFSEYSQSLSFLKAKFDTFPPVSSDITFKLN